MWLTKYIISFYKIMQKNKKIDCAKHTKGVNPYNTRGQESSCGLTRILFGQIVTMHHCIKSIVTFSISPNYIMCHSMTSGAHLAG